jgi:[ribosomal protein S18]-alanine N-acetyltransferase
MASARVRRAEISDLPFLEEMLFEAAFWRPSLPRPRLDVGLQRPELAKLLLGWGRPGDTALLAVSTAARPLGAAWYRFWSEGDHSYGFVSEHIPEVAIGVRKEARGRGIGGLLLRALLSEAGRRGIARVSLSVELDNPALRLYERLGFEKTGREGNAWTMVANAASAFRTQA